MLTRLNISFSIKKLNLKVIYYILNFSKDNILSNLFKISLVN